ncbi:MAG: beta-ketoacyl-ACP synthase II [Bacteroidetes bacterium]|jgi:3-oxoacyl-[acyl-carrier-protein] synthase II|nr:beta-ketoacyl-ACP synthase II [Bacteroidota bacterium]MBT3748418.1 beta-ketoacyl-ACP synthase II [Bacteroidota bacterium]MBT4398749.1 beta-ketoacyl-ACP synthase II [Bacteroidota bacterium]MBT4411696.1 beta-ketoacyl-ACP synthase II [Bacteroidota bacterium]MBT5424636.1 beta-ketoacyl-ACP synthase II [Bacteroidota bacterium]
MDLKRVVVTGLGALTPIGNTVKEFKQALFEGVSGADTITRFDPSNFKTKFACELKGYDPLDYFERKEARRLDIYAQYALITSEEAVKDAGLVPEELDVDRIGVIMSSGIGGLHTFEQEIIGFTENNFVPRFNPFFIPKMISDIASGHVSMRYGFRGPNYGTVAACATATMSIANAFDHIRLGRANVMVVGGSEGSVTRVGVGGFNAMHAISTRNDDPKTASRPFDVDRDGFVMGEGAATLILEEYEHAKARGAKIYCEVAGAGLSADAYHLTAPHPEGLGAANVMRFALEDANLKPEDIDYINVHGTSTPLGDIAEPLAIKKVFGDHAYDLSISSTKSMHGHLLGAAGAVESIASIFAITDNRIPPTINQFNLDPKIDSKLDFTFNKAKDREVRAALSNTFGFGGHNGSIIFKKS